MGVGVFGHMEFIWRQDFGAAASVRIASIKSGAISRSLLVTVMISSVAWVRVFDLGAKGTQGLHDGLAAVNGSAPQQNDALAQLRRR
jgi:hypothetical protein